MTVFSWLTESRDRKLQEKARLFRRNSIADSTRRSRDSQWRRYLSACDELNWTPLPCGVDQACKYVAHLAADLSYSSIQTYYQSVIFQHVCAGLEPVRLSNQVLQSTMNGIRRAKAGGEVGKDPLLPEHLRHLSISVNRSDPVEFVVYVAVLLLFRTLLRISHVISSPHTLLRSDVRFNDLGCLVRVRSSKTTRFGGKEVYIPVSWAADSSICAVRGLKQLFKIYPGDGNENLFSLPSRPSISYSVFSKVLKRLLERAGLEGNFSSHSLRRGGATHMSMVGCTVPQIKERGGWVSDCVFRYIKPTLSHRVRVDKKFASSC